MIARIAGLAREQRLGSAIEAYWRNLGYNVELSMAPTNGIAKTNSDGGPVWDLRSDLVNGLPHGFKAKDADLLPRPTRDVREVPVKDRRGYSGWDSSVREHYARRNTIRSWQADG